MPIHVPCGVHLIEFCIVARNSTTLMLSANLSSLRSIPFSSRKSPTFINQSPTPSLHRPPHPFHPGSSQARPSQHSRLSRRQKAISALPNKTSPLDPLPTSTLKKYSPILSPILSKLANLSFSTGVFPSTFKSAQVLPLLEKTKPRPQLPG